MTRRDARALLALLLCGCVAQVEVNEQAIVDGTASTDEAVVAIVGRRPACDDAALAACSGVLIAPRAVLTAAHCVVGFDGPTSLEVFFGPDTSGPGTFVVVAAGLLDPAYDVITGDHDLALLALASDAPATPLTLADTSLDTLAAGSTLRVVGYGTSGGTLEDIGARRTATMTLGAVRTASFDAAPGPGLSCRGDSGGPVFATIGGVERIVGITTSGDAACRERATQARVDVALDSFIHPATTTFAALGPAWPPTAIAVDQVGTTSCSADADCPALMGCDHDVMRCALPSIGPATFGPTCATSATCAGDVCARLWPDGADACRCAHQAVAPPPPTPPMGGGCTVGAGRTSWLGVLCLFMAMVAATRTRALGAAGAVLAAIVALFLWPRGPEPASPVDEAPEEPLDFGPPPTIVTSVHTGPEAPPPSTAPPAPLDLTGLTIAEQAALVGDDDLSDGLDLPPPAPHADTPPVERPPEFVPDTAHVLEQREQGLHLIDTSIERLRAEADDMEREGDHEGAARTRVRADRMTALRARRAEELETLRAGGSLPTPAEQLPRPAVPGGPQPPPPTQP